MSAIPLKQYTKADYMEMEEVSLEKNQYYQGEIFAMAGASIHHNEIVMNTSFEISSYLKGKKCRIYPSDLRIQINANSLITYPDLSIFCDDILTDDTYKENALNPTVIIEVLSPSTQNYDRSEKFKLYRAIESLQEYVLISSTEYMVELYTKQPDGKWLYQTYNSKVDNVTISAINFTLPLTAFYNNVALTG